MRTIGKSLVEQLTSNSAKLPVLRPSHSILTTLVLTPRELFFRLMRLNPLERRGRRFHVSGAPTFDQHIEVALALHVARREPTGCSHDRGGGSSLHAASAAPEGEPRHSMSAPGERRRVCPSRSSRRRRACAAS